MLHRFINFRHNRPDTDPTNIGNILVAMKLITREQLAVIVEDFRASKDELLGQFIVRKTTITEDQIELALIKQRIARGGGDDKVFDRLMEISKHSGDRVSSRIDELTTLVKQVVET